MPRTLAAVVEAPGAAFALQEIQLDEPHPNEVLVRMVAAGLCHTDLTVQAGHLPFALPGVLGHEGAGVVERVGSDVTRVRPGDHVVLSFTSCGRCSHCRAGHPAYCATWIPANIFNDGVRTDGTHPLSRAGQPIGGRFFGQSSFSAHALADERSVVRVDDDMPLELLAPLGCGIQTGAGTVLNVLKPSPGSSLAILGVGAVGLAALMAAALSPLGTVVAVDRVESRLALAKELGATHTVNGATDDVSAVLPEITGEAGLDYAIDTTANMTVLRSAIDALGTLGTCAVVGAAPMGTELRVDVTDILAGKKIVGVTEGDADPETLIPLLTGLYRQGRLPLDKLVRQYSIADINTAAADVHHGETIKPVLLFDHA
ncbi:NAD(P)-dependent alcohol dehydrogenase [Streptomyces ureilyticus]|uniref:NAD(P)-dependent alcohol dehydrogenase n=1 Tax=Streptomyces ureilyticus TaxID=1775131 RepID=A0ABX0E0M0_9ACTN|nr:NAD(P)-dependent alcohol dehydrogenase [Streptomyces ureilyticus]NGO47736.1 NAD(P)-dependent alcohol dehydrogenase [Streptomyces ureilyticus]